MAMDPEIKAMNTIGEALIAIEDAEGRMRVLRWANDKFGYQTVPIKPQSSRAANSGEPIKGPSGEREIPGIAMLSEDGELRLTVRNAKARSAVDAALRLTHIAIRAHERLTGEKSI